ncbi:MAG: hypothetical protein WAV41_03220 [Microgenomates group bacterium]
MDLIGSLRAGWEGASNSIAPLVGWFVVLAIVMFAWALLTTHKKGVLFTLGIVFIVGPLIVRYGPGLWTDSAIGGADSVQAKACKRYGGQYCNGLPGYAMVESSSSSNSGGGTTYAAPAGTDVTGGQQSLLPNVTVTVLSDAGTTWLKDFTVLMGGSLQPQNAPPALGPAMFPIKGVVSGKCSNCATAGKDNENWDIAINFDESWVTPIVFSVNGNIARNLGVSADRNGFSFTGTGKWETICQGCVTTITTQPDPIVKQPDPNTTSQSDPNVNVQPDPNPGDKLVTINDTSDNKGAWYYTSSTDGAGNPTCVGIDQNHDGTIPNNTSVTSVQLFVGAAWTTYLRSNDMLMVKYGDKDVCVFAGTAQ